MIKICRFNIYDHVLHDSLKTVFTLAAVSELSQLVLVLICGVSQVISGLLS